MMRRFDPHKASHHQRGRSPDGRGRPDRPSLTDGQSGRGGFIRRLEDSVIGDVLGALCLVILLIAALIFT